MSTQTEITRLQTARNKLRTWLVGLGLAASTDKLDAETNTLSVDTAAAVEKDNTKPVTSAAVYTEVGNINALLATI